MSTNAVSNQPTQATMMNGKAIKRLDTLTNWLLGAIVAIPFFISFGTLKALADMNGVSYPILYPLMVDGGLIIFKLLALRESLRGKRDAYTWGMAITLTIISVVLNILHVPDDIHSLWLARFMAALPPLVILGSFIAVSRRIEEGARMEGAILQYEQIVETIEQKRQELADMIQTRMTELNKMVSEKQAQFDELLRQKDVEVTELTAEIEQLSQQKLTVASELKVLRDALRMEKLTVSAVDLGKSTRGSSDFMTSSDTLADANESRIAGKASALDALLAYLADHPDATMTEAAKAIGRSRSTVSGYVTELTDGGRLYKNGHGWEVLA